MILLLSVGGELYSWGWNEHGMCGSGDEENITTPRIVKALHGYCVTLPACGAGHSFVVADKLPDNGS